MASHRILRLAVVLLALRLALDVATPLAPGAFVLDAGGIEGADAWDVRHAEPDQGRPSAAAQLPRHPEAVVVVETAVRLRPAAPVRRIERPLRLPRKHVVASDSSAAH
ncbi:MAG TPA: hypothetical protein VEA38_06475 [Terriglobales bacterium]|nr:hypothetical protein [Terriglobales bacterium]